MIPQSLVDSINGIESETNIHGFKSLQASRMYVMDLLRAIPDCPQKTDLIQKIVDQELKLQDTIRKSK